jgi:general secretion pathway protein L
MIGRFFRWWFTQLRELLPWSGDEQNGPWLEVTLDSERVRARSSERGEQLLMDVARAQGSVVRDQLGSIAATLDPARVRPRIWLDAKEVLTRDVELPMAAEENLREVMSFEMARKTPFRAADVHFDAIVTERNAAQGLLTLRVHVVPKRVLDPLLSAFADWSLDGIAAGAEAHTAQRREQAVFAFQGRSFRRQSFTGLNLGLAGAALALAIVCVWIPIKDQQDTLDRLHSQAQRAGTEAAQAMALRDELDAVQSANGFLSAAREHHAPKVQVIEALSRALPDNTFLTRLQIKGDQVNLHGSSGAASELIAILEALSLLDGVRFASPVTRDAANDGERFHIVARLLSVRDSDTSDGLNGSPQPGETS